MVTEMRGKIANAFRSAARRKEQPIELRQAVKDCYCGLGTACCHWEEMSPDERVACSCDKRASAENYWKTGTIG